MHSSKRVYQKDLGPVYFEVYSEAPNFKLAKVDQVHGERVACASGNSIPRADGLVSDTDLVLPLAIKTADCLPIVVLGTKGVGLLHAGWRGLALNIFQSQEVTQLSPYYFFIGPHISQKNYIVGSEFIDYFPESASFSTIDHHLCFGLEDRARELIAGLYPESKVESSMICTFDDLHFHSYRRNKTDLRNWNILRRG